MTVATDTMQGTYLLEGQAQKEARSNEWFDQLALNLAGFLSKDIAGAGTLTLTNTVGGEAHHATLRFTGALSGNRTVIVPSAQRVYFVGNLTTGAFLLTVSTAGGSGAVIPQNSWLILVCDGTNITAPAFTSGSVTVPPASESVEGVTRYGTTADHTAGTRDDVATTPLKLQQRLDAVLGGKQPSDPTLSALAGLSTSANQLPYFTGVDAAALTPLTAFARSLLDDADAPAGRATLLLGALAVLSSVGTAQLDNDSVTYAKLQNLSTTNRLLGRGSAGAGDVEELTVGSGLTLSGGVLSAPGTPPGGSSGQGQYNNGSGGFAGSTGLVLSATQVTSIDLASPLPLTEGGTGGSDVATARTNLGVLAGAPGTALSVLRYNAAGTALESAPGLLTAAGGTLGIGTAPTQALHLAGETVAAAGLQQDLHLSSASGPSQTGRHARGTLAAPTRVAAGDVLYSFQGQGWARDLGDTTDTWFLGGRMQLVTDTVDAQGRIGGGLRLFLAPGAGQPVGEALRVTQASNVLLGTTTHGTDLSKGVVLGSGTAPTASHPADAVQVWSGDTGGVASKAGLHVRTEDGTSHVLGDVSGIGTLCNAALGGGVTYRRLNVFAGQLFVRTSSTQERGVAAMDVSFPVSTDATRTGRLIFSVLDAAGSRETLRMEADGSAGRLGFFGAAAVARPSVPAAASDAGTNLTLTNSIRQALINLGLCV